MNMSFMLTTDQIKNRTKTVTRRLGWKKLKPGTIINACEKCQGLKKGEKIKKICKIRVVDVRREMLMHMKDEDCQKEGFPEMRRLEFIDMFSMKMRCTASAIVTRIEFEYI